MYIQDHVYVHTYTYIHTYIIHTYIHTHTYTVCSHTWLPGQKEVVCQSLKHEGVQHQENFIQGKKKKKITRHIIDSF